MHYRPDKFEKLYRQQDGELLWRFLLEHDNLVRMEAASYLGRPAVEPLSPALMQRFGGEVAQNRIKRMIGHMVRQIMEARGFVLDRTGVLIRRRGNIFYCASRYRHPAS
jgi:hypothetical protein